MSEVVEHEAAVQAISTAINAVRDQIKRAVQAPAPRCMALPKWEAIDNPTEFLGFALARWWLGEQRTVKRPDISTNDIAHRLTKALGVTVTNEAVVIAALLLGVPVCAGALPVWASLGISKNMTDPPLPAELIALRDYVMGEVA